MSAHFDPAGAAAYDRARPGYPEAAVAWLLGGPAQTVLELGAGTGKLTRLLAGLGHDVHVIEPDPALLAVLREQLPQVRADHGLAEEIPAPDRSVDLVIAAQAFGHFEPEPALTEIARVLKPGGHLALVWNVPDERLPWVRKLCALIGNSADADAAAAQDLLDRAEGFGAVEEAEFKHWQDVNRESLAELICSLSSHRRAEAEVRQAELAAALELYDGYGRGYDGMQLPYRSRCLRVPVLATAEEPGPDPDTPDDDLLLIDFR